MLWMVTGSTTTNGSNTRSELCYLEFAVIIPELESATSNAASTTPTLPPVQALSNPTSWLRDTIPLRLDLRTALEIQMTHQHRSAGQ